MEINIDKIIIFETGYFKINLTLVYTWFVILIISVISYFAGKKITSGDNPGRMQAVLEFIYEFIKNQLKQIIGNDAEEYIPFLGTIFIFIIISAVLNVIPLYHPPTSSLSTTSALALYVFFAVFFFGVRKRGIIGYLKHYVYPNPVMTPFHLISEFTRTLALALRLFGNTMSGTLVISILFIVVPLFVPVVMQMFEILIGAVQAYIFFVLSAVYIGAAISAENH